MSDDSFYYLIAERHVPAEKIQVKIAGCFLSLAATYDEIEIMSHQFSYDLVRIYSYGPSRGSELLDERSNITKHRVQSMQDNADALDILKDR